MKGIKREGGTELQTTCIRCGKDKLYVSIRKRLGYCFYCGKGYGAEELSRLGMENEYHAFTAVLKNQGLPDDLTAPQDVEAARAYLAGRNVKAKDCGSFTMYSPSLRRLFFRIWSPETAHYAPAWHTRGIDPGMGWVCAPGVQKQHYWFGHRGGPVLTVCEGLFDAISLHQRGVAAVALLGTQMSTTHLRGIVEWPGLQQVVVWMDDDEAGQKATKNICTQLEPIVNTVVELDGFPEPSESDEVPEACYEVIGNG